MVEVFKTNVQRKGDVKTLLLILNEYFPRYKINFDLEDCDKILRVEGNNISTEAIVTILTSNSYQCVVLD